MPPRRIPQPQRVRRIEGSFAWIDHRLLRHGHLAVMTHADQALYLFLCLVADRDGVSFYRLEKICDTLGLAWDEFHVARDRLIELGLIAFEPYSGTTPNGFYQVLPVDGAVGQLTTTRLRSSRGEAPSSSRERPDNWVPPSVAAARL